MAEASGNRSALFSQNLCRSCQLELFDPLSRLQEHSRDKSDHTWVFERASSTCVKQWPRAHPAKKRDAGGTEHPILSATFNSMDRLPTTVCFFPRVIDDRTPRLRPESRAAREQMHFPSLESESLLYFNPALGPVPTKPQSP